MTCERVWMVVSSLLLLAAAVFLWRNNLSNAFVTAALGACAWFLSYRAQLRKKIQDEENDEFSDSPDEE
ncbi:MAG: hypothetical protein ABR607_11410 [Pyrinomonadaceae bacterium]